MTRGGILSGTLEISHAFSSVYHTLGNMIMNSNIINCEEEYWSDNYRSVKISAYHQNNVARLFERRHADENDIRVP
jgi:hypothetical protein